MKETGISEKLVKTDCPLCGSGDFTIILRARDWFYGAPGVFTVSRCNNCSLVMQNPRPGPEKMADFYPDDYEPHIMAASGADLDNIIAGQESRRELLERFTARGRNLDAGSGDGRFMLCLKRAGWDVEGCEFVERMANYQRDVLGLNVKGCDLITAKYPENRFDSVTFWSVLEHLYNPVATLTEVNRILKPGGVAVVGVPNFHSLERLFFGQYWYALSVPYHLFFFTPRTMKKIVDKAGLVIERTFFSTTATSTIKSTKKIINIVSGQNAAEDSSSEKLTISDEPVTKSRDIAGLKKIFFNNVVCPVLKIFDILHVGGTTNYIIRKPL